jgi:hypothetical protein
MLDISQCFGILDFKEVAPFLQGRKIHCHALASYDKNAIANSSFFMAITVPEWLWGNSHNHPGCS